jgi:hypothetical protein
MHKRAHKIALWSETASLADYCTAKATQLMKLLAMRGVLAQLRLAVTPESLEDVEKVVPILRDFGFGIEIWPMTRNDEGRWLSRATMAPYLAWSKQVLARFEPNLARGDGWVFDIEPNFQRLHAITGVLVGDTSWAEVSELVRGFHRPSLRARFSSAAQASVDPRLASFLAELEARGLYTRAVMLPHVILPKGPSLGRVFGLPTFDARRYDVMLYPSMMVGLSSGAINRTRSRALLAFAARRLVARYGEHAGISLGLVATGALGNEPAYLDAMQFCEDFETVRHAGVAEVCLYDWGGILRSARPEAWFDAMG